MSHPRLRIAAAALALAIGASGCATSSYDTAHQTAHERQHSILVGHEVADNNDDGTYVSAGPITYQLEISRVLNPWGAEDSQYFKGLPKGTSAFHIKPDQLWYGVFLWAKNQHHAAHWTSDKFEITDTLGRVYRPVRLNPNVNLLAWNSRKLVYGETEPSQDSVGLHVRQRRQDRAVQAEHLDLLQPPAHALDPLADRQTDRRDLARPLARQSRSLSERGLEHRLDRRRGGRRAVACRPGTARETTTFGSFAGANATNHESVFFGLFDADLLAVSRSSAVPVLPATWTPGDLRGDAGAVLDHRDHHLLDLVRRPWG